ncbi:YgjP-like metallopeptidase domain-containing protein [Massilia cavernae]|uniref:M48 family peptidase n=1 Tax=Massilia cavernae TaxID=2320864 RepID=A0A418X6X2_9BURK|nr:YgjP-like metallopeptidase domain-containing protein [Massilia cavernae]RJG08245.1 M48 family peptidase [Massilia cavernae]
MQELKYLSAYSDQTRAQVSRLIEQNKLGEVLRQRYSGMHGIRTDRALYDYVQDLKGEFLRNADPINKVAFDSKIHVINHALGLHTSISRVQGSKLKAKHEIRVASMFKEVPLEFLRMIAVHELAHVKEKQHDKAFYKLCTYMEPNYHQYEFDLRLYLTELDLTGQRPW